MRKVKNHSSLKMLSAAALAGLVAFGAPAIAQNELDSGSPVVLGSEAANELLKQKPIDTPTLDYLKENNVLIPQKDRNPIEAPSSMYTITTGTEEDHTIDYTTADKNGNLTHNYYKIELRNPEFVSGSVESHVSWKEVLAPAEGASLPENTIEVRLSNDVTKYYQYTYTKPSNYDEVTTRINNTLTIENAQNKLFTDITTTSNGGAIYNTQDKSSVDIVADFIGNGLSINTYMAHGGAIYNSGTSGDITGNFIGNYVLNNSEYINDTLGGAIYNSGTIGDISGNFIGNYVSSQYQNIYGGAIYNNGTIGDITGNFIGNHLLNGDKQVGYDHPSGGAIYNKENATIGNITGNFINNSATQGGAIYNEGTIGNITGNFINNNGGAIDTFCSTIGNITGDFINNYGGAINNTWSSTINDITGNFINNDGRSEYGYWSVGAIYNYNSIIRNISGNFINNDANIGGAICNESVSSIGDITGNFINNSAKSYGGAISNHDSAIGSVDNEGNIVGGIINSNFIGNYVKVPVGKTAQGGAIYTNSSLNIIADNGTSLFKGNYTQIGEEQDDNAIYVNSTDASVNFQLKNNGQIFMYDNIRGDIKEEAELDTDGNKVLDADGNEVKKIVDSYKINITGDNTNTVFHMYNDMYNANLSVGNTTINTIDNQTHTYNVNTLTLVGDTNLTVDVDLKNAEMDRFSAKEYGEHNGNLNVIGMNMLSDAKDKTVTAIYFAEPGLKNNVSSSITEIPQKKYQTSVYTPIYKYNVKYDNTTDYGKGDGGYFLFTKGDRIFTGNGGGTSSTGNASDAFNPSVLSAPIAGVAASQATINETFKYVFEHADAFTKLPEQVRQAKIDANKYALSTDFNHNLGSLCPEHNNKAGWFRPYVTFEKMDLKNGPKVNATTYGSLAGFDTDFFEHKNGWHSIGTGYIGYNGSQLRYKGIDTTMNGGILGYTHTMYKGNFWSALTLSAGASVGQSNTMYGKEDFTSLLAGVGSKTGYNFEFKDGKYILQPVMFMSYTFVNTFDYTNAAGVKINADPAHSIQLNPSVRFIANSKNGWQPYVSVGMVWNVMNENKVSANNVRLPEMGMKPYVEYGVGIQRNWKDRFTAFGQAMLRNGGRTGISLTGGFRWAIGKEGKPIEKVQGVNDKKISLQSTTPSVIRDSQRNEESSASARKILKQLTPQQKMALTGKKNTTRTVNSGVLKQL